MATRLPFPGLENQGPKFISPHVRVAATIYPINDRGAWFARGSTFGDNAAGFLGMERPGGLRSTNARKLDFSEQSEASIISFSWNKQMGQAAGRWSITFKLKRDGKGRAKLNPYWFDVLDGDWVDVAVVRNGVRVPVCRGVVDSIREQTLSAGGATVRVFTLSGRDHGAFFEIPITWASIWVQTLGELSFGLMTKRVDGKVGGHPGELFKLLIDATFKKGTSAGPWALPSALSDIVGSQKTLSELLKVVTFSAERGGSKLRGAYYNEPQLWGTGGQTLHQTLAQWCNPVLNEWWYDLLLPGAFLPEHNLDGFLLARVIEKGKIPAKPNADGTTTAAPGGGSGTTTASPGPLSEEGISVGRITNVQQNLSAEDEEFGTMAAVIRERPFPNTISGASGQWAALPMWTIPTWLVQSSDLGISGDQRTNLIQLLADFGIGTPDEQAVFAKPRWNKADIQARGFRIHEEHTRFFSEDKGDWTEERALWQQIVTDWFCLNPYLRQGTITIRAPIPEIRPGQKLMLDGGPGAREQFYVEGVSVDFHGPSENAGASGTTTLVVTRGFRGDDDELTRAVEDAASNFKAVF